MMASRTTIVVLLVLSSVGMLKADPGQSPVIPDQFSLDIRMSVSLAEKVPNPPAPVDMKGYFDFKNGRVRHEWSTPEGNTVQIVTLNRSFTRSPQQGDGVCVILTEEVGRQQITTMRSMWDRSAQTYVGKVKLDDIEAHVWDSTKLPQTPEQAKFGEVVDLFYVNAVTNEPLLKKTTTPQGTSQSQFSNVKVGPLDDSLFDIGNVECSQPPTREETMKAYEYTKRASFWRKLNAKHKSSTGDAKERDSDDSDDESGSKEYADYGTLRGDDDEEEGENGDIDEDAIWDDAKKRDL